jgi:hypothetical protein
VLSGQIIGRCHRLLMQLSNQPRTTFMGR